MKLVIKEILAILEFHITVLLICTNDVGQGHDKTWSVLDTYSIVKLGQDPALFIPWSRLLGCYHISSWKMKCRLA